MTENRISPQSAALGEKKERVGGRRFPFSATAVRPVLFALAACSLCLVSDSDANPPKRAVRGVPRGGQGAGGMGEAEWDGVGVPPAVRSPRSLNRTPREVTPAEPARPTPNINHERQQPQRERQQQQEGRHLEPKSTTPSQHILSMTAKPAPQHEDFARRHRRHVARWLVAGIVPYSLGWQVESVSSGNTIRVRNPANVSQTVRLFAVTAPLEAQAFFSESRDRLSSQILGKTVNVQSMGSDETGTMIAKVFYGSAYVNEGQIADGMALYNANQGVDLALANAQIAAQEAGRGIWGDPSLVSDLAYDE
jgi:endonuclease YncB( thermonuclease family)